MKVITYNAKGCSLNGIFSESGYFVISEQRLDKLSKKVKKYKNQLNNKFEKEMSKSPLVDEITINPYEFFKSWTIHDIDMLDILKSTSFEKTNDGLVILIDLIKDIKNE